MNKKLYIAEYEGGAEYEPAEGGYYVPVKTLCSTSIAYGLKHIKREFKKYVKELKDYYGEPDFESKNRVHWTTGKYIGEEYEVRITSVPEKYEELYYGYC